MSFVSNEEFAKICESSDESDVEKEINQGSKRVREDISCLWCRQKLSKTAYYDRHKNGLCRKESSDEDLNISSNQEFERLPVDEDLEETVAPLTTESFLSHHDAFLAEVIHVWLSVITIVCLGSLTKLVFN